MAPKRFLHDAHAGEAEVVAQCRHIGCDRPQVFGHDGQLAERAFDGVEQRLAWPRCPAPFTRGGATGRHFPIARETAEMVDAQDVGVGERALHAGHPPGVFVIRHAVPAVQRVAPALAVGAEAVGRHAGHHAGLVLRVQKVQVGPGPDIDAVVGDEDRQVAHQTHTPGLGVGAQGGHLLVETPLHEGVLGCCARQALACGGQRVSVAAGECLAPQPPRLAAVFVFQCREERPFMQPRALRCAPGVEGFVVGGIGPGEKAGCRFTQQGPAPGDHRVVVHAPGVESGLNLQRGLQRRRRQPAALHQRLQRHHQAAAGEG